MGNQYMPKEITSPFMPSEELLPAYDDIPDEFKRFTGTKWNKLFNDMFFYGLKSLTLFPKDGIDKEKAWRHIRIASQGRDSKHEHKAAGVSYLMSLWFEDAKWETSKES